MAETLGFGDRLAQAMVDYGPLCVGIDPHPDLLTRWGLEDSSRGLADFSARVLEAAAGRVAALKPQIAFFERHGSSGFAVLEDLLAEARAQKVPVIADAKRGDIGSTMSAYADTWLGKNSALSSDAVTLSPYLGFDSLRPALDLASRNYRGSFVLALTSNPEGKTVQHAGTGSASVAQQIINSAYAENEREEYQQMGSCGLVIGATVGVALKNLKINISIFNGPILSPGYGAQGASAEDLYRVFRGIENRVLVNSSREILAQGPSVQALVHGIGKTVEDLRQQRKKTSF